MKSLTLLFLIATIFLSGCVFCNKLTVSSDISVIAGGGLSGVKDGESWETKGGGILGVESVVHEISLGSFIHAGSNLSFQGASYTDSYDFNESFSGVSLKSNQQEEFSGKVNLIYLNFPVMYRYQSEGGFFGEIGLQPGFLLSAKDKYNGGSGEDYKDHVKGFEVGLPVGVGYKVNDKISIGARGIYGITNFDDTGSSEKDHNYMFLGTVKYNFGKLFKSKD